MRSTSSAIFPLSVERGLPTLAAISATSGLVSAFIVCAEGHCIVSILFQLGSVPVSRWFIGCSALVRRVARPTAHSYSTNSTMSTHSIWRKCCKCSKCSTSCDLALVFDRFQEHIEEQLRREFGFAAHGDVDLVI